MPEARQRLFLLLKSRLVCGLMFMSDRPAPCKMLQRMQAEGSKEGRVLQAKNSLQNGTVYVPMRGPSSLSTV